MLTHINLLPIQNFLEILLMKSTGFIVISDVLREAKDLAILIKQRKNKQIILSLVSGRRSIAPSPCSPHSRTPRTQITSSEPRLGRDDRLIASAGSPDYRRPPGMSEQRFAGVQLDGGPPVSCGIQWKAQALACLPALAGLHVGTQCGCAA